MYKLLSIIIFLWFFFHLNGYSQTNEWMTDYVTLDDEPTLNFIGFQTPSVAVVGPNRFVALVAETPSPPILQNLFNPGSNYLVGYWDADSITGRVVSPINGQQTFPLYSTTGQYTSWGLLDVVQLNGAWQLASDDSNRIYVANNDPNHNILVFQIDATGVTTTDYRMEASTDNIFAIEVDGNGYVYVADYEGNASKTDEVKVYAGIGAPGTTWGDFGGHNDTPVTTIDLPIGIYQGVTVNSAGTELFISASSQRSVLKFIGDPVNGYTLDTGFQFTLADGDTLGIYRFTGTDSLARGTPTTLGLAYLNDPPLVYAVVDTFFGQGNFYGYSYGRIYVIDPSSATPLDTIDIAEWNWTFNNAGTYTSATTDGRRGGYTSVVDVDIEQTESGIYTQTYYGWAVEKWIFDGDLSTLLSIEQIASNIPQNFTLRQNYPNPFNPTTTIEFDIQKTGNVTLEVYNLMGQKVAALMDEKMNPGTYRAVFDGSGLASGIYFYKLKTETFTSVKKMILSK